jgi:hypothetical protein
VSAVRVTYYDERDGELDTITVRGADKAAIPLEAQHLRVRVLEPGPGPEPDMLSCCGFAMRYEEFEHVRRYYCTYRSHHPVVYVDQRTGYWERRE